ncbi:MAG: hypothetical protein LBU74_07860 [Methanobacteriaceae archaeon]|jgi:sporulation protein YlmC with PRC-barrel domain|nr:hypothetical protein [Candidatus Methanorudis spinitermitis]
MVEISYLHDLDIYTMAGKYQGRIVDVVLNMRLGTISKIQVKALNHETKENEDFNIAKVIKKGLWIESEEDEVDNGNVDLFNVDFDKVKAIGDIMLIDPHDLEEQN